MSKKNIAAIAVFLLIMTVCTVFLLSSQKEETRRIQALKMDGVEVFFPEMEVSALYHGANGLWVGGKDGIMLVDAQSGQSLGWLDSGIEMIYAAGICQTADGLVWAGHNGGVTAYTPEGGRLFSFAAPEIPSGRVNALMAWGEGLWLGAEHGAAYLEPDGKGGWRVGRILTAEDGLASGFVSALAATEDELWFGAYLTGQSGGLSILSPGAWSYISVDQGLPHRYVNAILPLDQDTVLVGTGHLDKGGLCTLRRGNGGVWQVEKTYGQAEGMPGAKIRQLFLDSSQRIWITREADGILICPSAGALRDLPVQGMYLTEQHGLSDNEIKCLVEAEECFWLGGRRGLTKIARGTLESA
ncbi:MAG: hypothetical protein PHD67_06680 [Oscillospiraceae bacterium]|nr:hypothetical protein [Oscillospiraceae bacterium]